MVAIGPRVGGAHVDVNLKFDDKSLVSLGKRIHSQLADIGRQNRSIYRSIGSGSVTAWRAALGAALSAAPLIGGAVSALAGTVTELAGSFYSLGQSATAALPILTSLGIAGLTASIGLNNFASAVSETNPKALNELLSTMPAEMQKAVLATRDLSNSLREALFPKLFAGLSDGISSLNNTGVIQRGLEAMAGSINGLVRSLLDYANTDAGNDTIDKFLKANADVFAGLSKAVVPFLDSFLRLVTALSPAALRLSDRLTDLGKHFQDLTQADDFGQRIDDSMKKAETTAGLLLHALANLGGAIGNVFSAANPATNSFLQTLVDVTQRFEDFSASAKGEKSIAEWAYASNDVIRQFGRTVESVFKVVQELADARIIISFLKTVQGAFDIIAKLPLDTAVTAFANITESLQPISSLFLAIVAGAVVFNIAVGALAAQLGGLFFILESFGGLGGLFVFAGLAALPVAIGVVIARSDRLQKKLGEVFQAGKGVIDSLGHAFDRLVKALSPVATSLEPVVKSLEKMARVAIGNVLDGISSGLDSLSGAIDKGAKAIPSVVRSLTNLFQVGGKDFGAKLRSSFGQFVGILNTFRGVLVAKVLPVLKTFGTYLVDNVVPIFGQVADIVVNSLIPTFLALANFMYGTVYPALVDIVTLVATKLAPVFTQLVDTFKKDVLPTIDRFITSVRTQLLPALAPLIKKVLIVVGALAGFAAIILGKVLPPLIRLAGFIFSKIVPAITGFITIVALIIDFLIELGITIFNAGKNVYEFATSIDDAISNGINNVIDTIKGLPGVIIGLVPKMLEAGKKLIGGFFDGLLDAAKGIGGFLGDVGDAVLGAVIGAFNNVVQFINDALPDKISLPGPVPDINLPDDPLPKIPGYAKGTSFYPGGIGLVGEQGPELVSLPRGSKINTADETRGILGGAAEAGGAGGGNIYIGTMQPHNYGEFERQMRDKKRLAALGGRRPVTS